MGVLEELLRQMQEAAEQGQRTGMPGMPRPPAAPEAPVAQAEPRPRQVARPPVQQQPQPQHQRQQVQRQQQPQQTFVKRARQPEPVEPPSRPVHPAYPEHNTGEDPVHRLVSDSAPAMVTRRIEHPLFARLRDPKGLRDAFILSEILRPRTRR